MKLPKFLRRKHRSRSHIGAPVPPDMFRLLVLTDDPWLTFSGWRGWCSGEPYWEDGACECAHQERATV